MLKDFDNFYFLFYGIKLFIKLKKDYIAGLKNTANFIIIGGCRDTRNE
jgi:DNA ligase 4